MSAATMDSSSKKAPLSLEHHFSEVTKRREPSKMKEYYKYFEIPGIGNLAGGLPHSSLFPFDTLEAQAAKPERWEPSPIPDDGTTGSTSTSTSTLPIRGTAAAAAAGQDKEKDVKASRHVTVPGTDDDRDPLRRIDVATALQYGTAEGYPPLRSFIRQFTRDHLHPDVPYLGGPEVILSCGATDGFSKTLELITNPWSPAKDAAAERPGMLCEVFVYSQVLSQALPRGIQVVPVEMDDGGMIANGPGGLEEVLAGWDEKNGKRPHFIYTVTMGHNPTSGILSVERRKEIYAIASKYDVIIVEDDPYWYLQYPSAVVVEAKSRGLEVSPSAARPTYKPTKSSGYQFLDSLTPSFLSIDTDGRVIRLDTFSKTIAPGCRMGWITAQPAIIERLLRITEVTTQQPSGFVQSTVAELIMGDQPPAARSAFAALTSRQKQTFEGWKMDGWVRWLAGLRGVYERRMNRMCTILDEGSIQLKQSTPRSADDADWGVVSKTQLYEFAWPRGGMFIWLKLRLETHPLWMATGGERIPLLDGERLSTALMFFATKKPYRVLVSPGLIFSATPAIRAERGWAYFRLCFAAETEENVDLCAQRLADAIQRFWRIKKVEEVEDLLGDFFLAQGEEEELEGLGNLGSLMGC